MIDLIEIWQRQREWSDETFGPGTRMRGVVAHIRKELGEIEAGDGKEIEEWVDVMVLAVDGATRQGFTPKQLAAAYVTKIAKNMSRKWPDWRVAPEDRPIEHIRANDPTPLVLGIVGKAGAGKSTIGRHLSAKHNFARRPLAYGLKAMLGALGVPAAVLDGDSAAKSAPLAVLNGSTYRHAAQALGTEWGRAHMGQDFWIDNWRNTSPPGVSVVADDVRFLNEAQTIRNMGGYLIRVTRKGAGAHDEKLSSHASETEQDSIVADYEIENNGTVEELHAKIDKLVSELLIQKRA